MFLPKLGDFAWKLKTHLSQYLVDFESASDKFGSVVGKMFFNEMYKNGRCE